MSNPKVIKALAAASETRALEIGAGVLKEVGTMFAEMFPEKRAIIIADPRTYKVAGEAVSKALTNAGIEQLKPFIITDPDLYAEFSFVEMVDTALADNDAIPIAVGSGTINDLVKLSSHRNGRRYMCVATAASMDGYTAFGASITYEGAKQTLNCPAPLAVLADTEIIAAAPAGMTASGYADLFAKITAGADWIISDELGVEPIEPTAWSIVQDGLADALRDPVGALSGKPECIEPLVEGLILGGFAMQSSKSSRPASGAEHQFSHLWDMEHHKVNGKSPSHGFKVSIGMLASTALYEQLLATDIANLDIDAACAQWADRKEAEQEALTMFANTDFPTIGVTETEAKYINRDELRVQLQTLKSNWTQISERLRKQIIPFEETKRRLELVGAPITPEQIGITRSRLLNSFLRAQHIRRRFTILDVAVRTGMLNKWLNNMFGKKGIWEIEQNDNSKSILEPAGKKTANKRPKDVSLHLPH